jgi:hypothetical protein
LASASMRLWKQIWLSQWNRGFSSLNETSESFVTLRKPLWKRILTLNSFTHTET